MKLLIRIANVALILLSATFFSCEKQQVPSLTTAEVTNISGNTSTCGGIITDEGSSAVIKRGVCWNTENAPVITDYKTSNGTGTGPFTSNITGLDGSTTYYVRAYANNKYGTGYGNEVSFLTGPRKIKFNPSIEYGNITDQDGNIYKTVKVGEQIWMAENLRTTHYLDGSPIQNVTEFLPWTILDDGAYCFYSNDTINRNAYGALYNWFSVADQRRICPDGWHVPSDEEWTLLEDFLGGRNFAGMKMKEVGLAHWVSPNASASNQSGLTALPAGSRFYWTSKDDFNHMGYYCLWWTSTENLSNQESAWYRVLNTFNSETGRNSYWKIVGFSVRCVMD